MPAPPSRTSRVVVCVLLTQKIIACKVCCVATKNNAVTSLAWSLIEVAERAYFAAWCPLQRETISNDLLCL